jgi:glycosyltransferase involved in cell wall biosynthesis
MANYNNGAFIDEAIGSVLSQTFTDWELVIVDDASTDDSRERIKKYLGDTRIRFYAKKRNEGYTKAVIYGLAKVASEVVGVLDSDDALVPEAIEKVHAVYAGRPELGLVLSQVVICDSNLKPLLTTVNTLKHLTEPLLWMRGPTAFRSFKMAAYCRTSGINPRLLSGEDADLLFKLEEVAPVYRIDEPLYLYRQLSWSLSKGARTYFVTYHSIASAVYSAYCRRRHTEVPNLPRTVVLAWLAAAVRYAFELGEPGRAMLFAFRGLRIALFEGVSYRTLRIALRAWRFSMRGKDNGTLGARASLLKLRFYPIREFQSNTGNIEADRIKCIPLVHKGGHCLFGGDYLILENGRYRATFEMTVDAYPFAYDPLVVLDIHENLQTKRILAERDITMADLQNQPMSYAVDFFARQGQRVEYRVYWKEQCYLIVRGVVLEKMNGDVSDQAGLVN